MSGRFRNMHGQADPRDDEGGRPNAAQPGLHLARERGVRVAASDEHESHRATVSAWMAAAGGGLARGGLVALLDAATAAIWQRAQRTLGDVTLAAILDRVVSTSAEQFPFLAKGTVGRGGVVFASPDGNEPALDDDDDDDDELRAAMAFFLVELLTVIGHLTAEILTPALHEALTRARGEGR